MNQQRDIIVTQIINELGVTMETNTKPLIRCKDCKYRFVDGENVKYNCCELNRNKYMANEWHCADGERREP